MQIDSINRIDTLVSVNAMKTLGLPRLLATLALCCTLCAPRAARADDANTGAKAKEHYLKGQTHYALGEFNEAITEFREAFRLRDEPAILFNIAQAMRQLNNYKQAYFYYSQYLSKRPNASNRPEVEGFMEAMHKKMEADEDVDKARANAEAARPSPPKHPDDHLAEAEGQKHAATLAPPAAPAKAPEKADAKAGSKKVAAAALAKPAAASTATAPSPTTSAAPPAAALPAPAAQRSLPAPLEATTPAPPSSDKPGWATGPHLAGAAALGVGALSGVLSFVFHGSAQAAADTLDQHYASHAVKPEDIQLKDTVKSKGQLATMAAIGCAALVVTGAVLTFAF